MATMLDYIMDEQRTLTKIVDEFDMKQLDLSSVRRCLILATGSSYNASLAAKYFIEKMSSVYIDIQEPFNYLHYAKIDTEIDLVLAVSQSGKSSSTINAIKRITNETNAKTIILTSDKNSPITNVVSHVLDLNMGIETVGFVTKGYSATVLNLMLLGLSLAYQNGEINSDELSDEKKQLKKAISAIDDTIKRVSQFWQTHQQVLSKAQRFIAIGYGPNVGTVKEFETKFTETVRLPSQGFELEAYMHGPYLEANLQHYLFFIESDTTLVFRSRALRNYLKPYIKRAYSISSNPLEEADFHLGIHVSEKISPLLLVIFFQYLSYQISTAKGIDLNQRIFDDFDQQLESKQ